MKAIFGALLAGCVCILYVSARGQAQTGAQTLAEQQHQAAQLAAQQAALTALQRQIETMRRMVTTRLVELGSTSGAGSALIDNFRPVVGKEQLGNPAKLEFSLKPGPVDAGTTVRITCDTHYSTIYYTVDGWTPTMASTRYTGPIPINATTRLLAMAVGPNLVRSQVAHVDYTVKGGASDPVVAVEAADGMLRGGTKLRLVTTAKLSSETAQVGDDVKLVLDQDVKVGDAVVVAKGAPVDALLTYADSRAGSLPGDLVFEVRGLKIAGKTISLIGGETLEGQSAVLNTKEAEIVPGMVVAATVAEDTALQP